MKKNLLGILIIFTLVFFIGSIMIFAVEKRIEVSTGIHSVKVFPDRAEVTRKFHGNLEPGIYTLVFSHLPIKLDDQSIRVVGDGIAKAKILDIKTGTQSSSEAFAEQTRQLEAEKNKNNKEIRSLNDKKAALEKKEFYLESLMEKFTNSKTESEKNKVPVPAMNEFTKMLNFLEDRYNEIFAKKRELEEKIDALKNGNSVIDSKLETNKKGSTKPEKNVTVALDVQEGGTLNVSMSYMVADVSWAPVYDLQVTSKSDKATFNSSAIITQQTGEDWENVLLTLSTIKPLEKKELPVLKSRFIDIISNKAGMLSGKVVDETDTPLPGVQISIDRENRSIKETYSNGKGQFKIRNLPIGYYKVNANLRGFKSIQLKNVEIVPGKVSTLDILLPIANVYEQISIEGKPKFADMEESDKLVTEEEQPQDLMVETAEVSQGVLAAEFVLKHSSTIPSSSEGKKVSIDFREIPAGKEYIAIPRQSQYVYLQTKLKNTGETFLIPGPLNLFFDGTLVNTSDLKLLQQGEDLDLPLGVEEAVNIEWHPFKDEVKQKGLLKKKNEFVSGYTIKLKNRKQMPLQLTVFDLVPVSKNKKVKVEIPVLMPKPDSNDLEKGILSWKLLLNPGEVREIKVKYVVTHPDEFILHEFDSDESEE